jgi:tetratricopeptide (TPR) repeat protein
MLETIRQYAQERLVLSGVAGAVRGRHTQWYADFARTVGRGLYSPEEGVWSERLRDEVDNLQVAVAWAVAAGETEAAMRIGASFPRQGSQRPLLGTAYLAEQAMHVRGADEHPLRARVLAEAAWATLARGDPVAAEQLLRESIDAQRHGARYAAAAFTYLLRLVVWLRVPETRRQITDEGLAMAEAAGDVLGANGLRSASAVVALEDGREDDALQHAQRALADARSLRQPTLEISALYVNGLVLARIDPLRAIAFLNESVELARRMGVEGDETGAFELLANLEAQRGDSRRALEALREAALHSIRVPYSIVVTPFYTGTRAFLRAGRPDLVALCDGQSRVRQHHPSRGASVLPALADVHDQDVREARSALGDEAFQRYSDAGAAIPSEDFSQTILREIDNILAAT